MDTTITKITKTDLLDNIGEALSKARALTFLIGHAGEETPRSHLESAVSMHTDLIDEADRNIRLLADCKE